MMRMFGAYRLLGRQGAKVAAQTVLLETNNTKEIHEIVTVVFHYLVTGLAGVGITIVIVFLVVTESGV